MSDQKPQQKGSPHIDPARMEDLSRSLGEGLLDVIGAFLEDTPQIISEMRRCSVAGDLENLSRLAHSLKSSSGIFGADRLAAVCLALEEAEQVSSLTQGEIISGIADAFNDVRNALELYR